MALFLDRIDSAPIVSGDFDPQFLQWLWVLIDTLNETIGDIQNAFNFLTAPNFAMLNETVTLTLGLPSLTVANGTIYNVSDAVIGNGIPQNSNIISIAGNVITLDANATISGSSALTFIPSSGGDIGNGILLYDTTNKVYVGMQNGALVKFTTTAYP